MRLPVFFLGHGSPMNALEKNSFTEAWQNLLVGFPPPRAILFVSAHWETSGTQVTAMEVPRTIHDFGGFPQELYEVEFPAKGSEAIADEIIETLGTDIGAQKNFSWGLDHGTWSILVHTKPPKETAILQLSLDLSIDTTKFLEIGKRLQSLRERGVLLCGSGNIVHNLRLVDWNAFSIDDYAHPWAREADALIRNAVLRRDLETLTAFESFPQSMQWAINSAEHYIPLLYMLGATTADERVTVFNAKAVAGALTMTSFKWGCPRS